MRAVAPLLCSRCCAVRVVAPASRCYALHVTYRVVLAPPAFRIVNLLIGFLLVAHWLACGFFFVAKVSSEDVTWAGEQWPQGFEHASVGDKYITYVDPPPPPSPFPSTL